MLSKEYPCARVESFYRFFASFCIGRISHQQRKGLSLGHMTGQQRVVAGILGKSAVNKLHVIVKRDEFYRHCEVRVEETRIQGCMEIYHDIGSVTALEVIGFVEFIR